MMKEIWFRNWFFVIFLCGYLYSTDTAFANEKIFILHSYHQEYPWTYNENKGFTETFADDDSIDNITFSTEYLDTKRVKFTKEYQIFFFKYLKQKYAFYSPDVVFCSDDNALTFLLQFKERLFGDAPVVFCGVNNLDIEAELKSKQYTGIFEKKEISPNLTFLEKIFPHPGKIIFLGDNSSTHQAIEQQIRVDMASHFANQKYIILTSSDLPDLITQLKKHKEGVVFLTTIGGLKDGHDNAMTLKESIESIVSAGNFKIISMEDVYLKKGVLGGYVTSGFSQGKEAANFAIQILKGKSPSSISLVKDSPNKYMFNYPQLKKLGISTSLLPPNSIVLNKPQSFYGHYKYWIWATVMFLILQALIIFALTINIFKRKAAEASLKKSRDNLERRVVERTSELSKTNENLEKEIIEREQIEEELKESEARFRALHDASFGGVIIHNKGLILDCNQGLSDITGFTNEELIGMDGLKLIAPDWLDLVLRNIKSEYDKSYEVEGVRKDGSVYPLTIRGKNVLYKGREERVIEFRDISELKQAEEELKSEQVRLRTLFNESPVGITSSRDGITLDANRTYLDMFGYDDISELKGQSILEKIAPQFRKEFEDRAKKRADGKKVATSYESVGLRKDGSQFPFMVSVNRIILHEEPITFSFLTDITERKQAEGERENLQTQLNQAQKMETIGTMAGGLAHDYNNLLAVIQGNIDMAEEDAATDSPQAKALNTAMRAAQRAASLTKKFITFSSGGSPLKTAINPQEFLKDTVNIALSGSNIQCDFSIDQDLGVVEIDQDQMSQAIDNIVTNAKEAMPQGGLIHLTAHNMSGAQMTHETGLKLQGDFFIKIAVEDQGKGIPKKILATIFDPYFSSKDRGTQKGMGLGLTIANSIIKKHAGYIQMESEEGKGATISIYLPVLQQNEAVVCQSTDKIVDSPPKAREKETTKILIMDDEKMINDMGKRMLEALGYKQVEVAPHGEDALKMYTQARDHGEPFDLLLLDLTIKGGMGGEETIKKLHEMNPEVRAIVCSGYSKDPIVANYAAYGFIGVLAKPFSREELNNAITQALDKK